MSSVVVRSVFSSYPSASGGRGWPGSPLLAGWLTTGVQALGAAAAAVAIGRPVWGGVGIALPWLSRPTRGAG